MLAKHGSVKVVDRYRCLTILEGLALISENNDPYLDLSKDRHKCFLHNGWVCAGCGLEATFFAIEYVTSESFSGYTLNLYGVKDNKEYYFTKDHIVPKSLGGKDELNNYQTMCWECNAAKGSRI